MEENIIKTMDEQAQKRILVVDDDEGIRSVLDIALSDENFQVIQAATGEQALQKAKEEEPDLIILDIMMPGFSGIEVKDKLNGDLATSLIPVIFLTGKGTTSDKVQGFNLGVDDYITKPFELEELLARVNNSLSRRRFYEDMFMTDGLTGLYNLHYFKKQFTLFFNMAKRYDKAFSLAIIDVNDFKQINDTHSHAVGDFVLKTFASILRDMLRESDIIVRYGGDEFAVIFPTSDHQEAVQAMERVRAKVQQSEFKVPEKELIVTFSVSIGIAQYTKDMISESRFFELADMRMYEDKRRQKS